MNAKQLRDRIWNSPATHGWVLKLIPDLEQKDPVDVLTDLHVLTTLWRMKVKELSWKGGKGERL